MKNPLLVDVIKELCLEINKTKVEVSWMDFSNIELIRELIFCILSSQTHYELAVKKSQSLDIEQILNLLETNQDEAFSYLEAELLKPEAIEINGISFSRRIRFYRRNTKLILGSLSCFIHNQENLSRLLSDAKSGVGARQEILQRFYGIGPKQASLFLRRIGYCSHLAIIDTHIVDFMFRTQKTFKVSNLSSLKVYESLEKKFQNFSKKIGFSVGVVDLATWITVREAKRLRL